MDQGIKTPNNVCLFYADYQKAIDCAVWLNFWFRNKGMNLLTVIDGPKNDYAVVSMDIKESFSDQITSYPLFGDYADLNYEMIENIYSQNDPLDHWEEINGALSVTDGEALRFIIQMKIPLEKFIRYELASRGFDQNGKWCGFERAKRIWLKE